MQHKYTRPPKGHYQHVLDMKTSQVMDKIQLSKWEVTLGATDRANITCPMHDTHTSQIDDNIQHIVSHIGFLFHKKLK